MLKDKEGKWLYEPQHLKAQKKSGREMRDQGYTCKELYSAFDVQELKNDAGFSAHEILLSCSDKEEGEENEDQELCRKLLEAFEIKDLKDEEGKWLYEAVHQKSKHEKVQKTEMP